LVLPAYTLVNPYLQMNPTKALRISLQVYNVFNTLGMTQFTTINSPGNIADTFSGYGEGQTVQGRTGTLRVRLTF
jgi:outer membrane receptor protein involved in Fe transport